MPIIGTPDFGQSDIWNLNLANKFFLWLNLQTNQLPFWSKNLGTGFPIFAEGQIGALNIYNLIAFKFLPYILAFNLGLIFSLLTAFTGTYLFSRAIKISRYSALFAALTFSLSGLFITHLTHYNLIQTASFLPLQFFLVEKFRQTSKSRFLILYSFFLSQQIYSGFPQLVLITLIGLGIYIILNTWSQRKFRKLIPFSIFTGLGFIFSLPQLIPTIELVLNSYRQVDAAEMVRFPYPPKHLLTFFYPYLFGDPRNGTYPHFSADWGIFWESTAYVGIVPIFLLPIAFFTRKHPQRTTFIIIACISLILLLGKFTPLFILFQVPPLSFFRVPSRFLFLFTWSLVVLSAIALNKISPKIQKLITSLSLANILYFALTYNAIVPSSSSWLATPQTAKILKQDRSFYRIIPLSPFKAWNDIFYKEGWEHVDRFQAFTNSLTPNQNLFWQIPSIDFYHSGLAPKRLDLMDQMIKKNILLTENIISSESAKLLSIQSVKYIISSEPLISPFTPIATTASNPKFTIYKNPNAYPHSYLSNNYSVASSISDLQQQVADPLNSSVVLEENINIPKNNKPLKVVSVVDNFEDRVVIRAQTDLPSLLVLTDSYYPGWTAKINGNPTKIYPVNLNQRGVIIPEGESTVVFSYLPYNLSSLSEELFSLLNRK